MSMERRDLLKYLGIAGAATLVNGEAVGKDYAGPSGPDVPNLVDGGREGQLAIAAQLEKLAAGIRAGDLSAVEMKIGTAVKPNDPHWLTHDVTISVEMLKDHVA